MKLFKTVFGAALAGAALLSGAASAAGGGNAKELLHPHFPFEGPFGHFDKAQLQRGFQVYKSVCANCHSFDLVAVRHLGERGAPYYLDRCPRDIGIPETTDCSDPIQNPIIKSLAASYQIEDGPDDAGDMFMRPGLPADYFPAPFANREQAMAANGGAYPPDLSLYAKARHHGPAYIASVLQGYEAPPETVDIPVGQYYNVYYDGDMASLLKPEYLDDEGHVIEGVKVPYGGVFKMPQPLFDGMVPYEDGSPETVRQYSEDVANFLMWAAEPKLEQRKAQGRFILIYLVIFAGIVYVSYRQIWRKVH